jgi:GT2 family glycosyltransferase
MTDPATVAVVVVNWNGRAYLDKCLSALRAQTYRAFEIVLVDNASIDDSVDLVRRQFPEVKVIRLDQNMGFAAANNAGIRATRSDYVALINNDAYAEPAWLAEMIEAAQARPAAGMIACKVLFDDDPRMINSAGLVIDWAGFCWDWRGGQLDQPAEAKTEEAFGPCGAAALYRRAMLDDVGLFDEDFHVRRRRRPELARAAGRLDVRVCAGRARATCVVGFVDRRLALQGLSSGAQQMVVVDQERAGRALSGMVVDSDHL